mgnify:CR=1 FL=1
MDREEFLKLFLFWFIPSIILSTLFYALNFDNVWVMLIIAFVLTLTLCLLAWFLIWFAERWEIRRRNKINLEEFEKKQNKRNRLQEKHYKQENSYSVASRLAEEDLINEERNKLKEDVQKRIERSEEIIKEYQQEVQDLKKLLEQL